MKNIFEIICKKCVGKCCKTTIFLTQKDIDRLEKYKEKFRLIPMEKDMKAPPGYMDLVEGSCPFLEEEKGCTLRHEEKPFDCRVFPLAFIYKAGETKFYLNKKCPYYDEIPEEWIHKTKIWAQEELKNWSEDEKLAFSKMIERYQSKQLIPV
ncbi:YkgJ family cysteine cluster protein [Candidatus Dojkabacteria bacterium]|nr:YkgJ family cysteine cluster protein [Candidatus Dojkabacteria bacterium]